MPLVPRRSRSLPLRFAGMLSPRDAALLEAYARECEDCARAASIEGARANARLSVDIQRTATLKRFVRRLNDTPRKCLDFKPRHSPNSNQSLHFKRDSISLLSQGRHRVC